MPHHLRAMPIFRRAVPVVLLAFVAVSTQAAAQQLLVTVTVSDSASHRPLSSAVLIFLDAGGTALARNITNERGQLSASLSPEVRRVRALRLGYRAREVPMPTSGAGTARLDIAMLSIPALLEPVTVVAAASCPRRDDSRAALALLEQARAGLLATIVAREANPAAMKLLSYERTMDGNSDRIERQSVHVDSVGRRVKSYEAAATASDFVEHGFSRDSAGMRYFFGPDADVLLDEGFSNGYCFRIHDSERTRPNQVGLGFSAANKKKGRVDIEGALWIDTVAHTLKDINFRFMINPRVSGVPDEGGQVSFREMPNGMVLIDRWMLRLAAVHSDTSYARGMEVRRFYFSREVGGEVARAIWPDGYAWKASLATVQLHVVTQQGEPARSAIVRLDDTDYLGSPNSKGDLEIPDVLPGPYKVVMIDTALAPMGISLGTTLKLFAQRDSTIRASLIEPPAEAFLRKHCATSTERHWVSVRVARPDGAVVVDGTWELGEDFGTSLEYMHAKGQTGLDGDFGFCSDAPHRNGALQLRVSDNAMPRQDVIVVIQGTVTDLKIELPGRPKSP